MTSKDKKYRGFNEIYFVLYLMAVLLLLPEGKKIYDEYIVSEQNNAYIKSEKSSLNVKLKYINGKSTIISADTVNVIYPVGKIDSIKYNFRIINNNISNDIYQSDVNIESTAFEIIENNEGLVRFEWSPQKINSFDRNFEVKVDAKIFSLSNSEPSISSVRFAVNTYYIDDEIIIAANEQNNSNTITDNSLSSNNEFNIPQNNQSQIPLNSISFFPENPVTAMALTRWNSVVRVFGVDLTKEIKGLPKLKFDSKYDVKVENIENNSIYLSGITSAEQPYKVEVEIERNADNRIASTEFIVKPLLIPYPDYKKVMYPNYSYTIKTNLPRNNKSSAKLFYKDKLIISSEDGSNIEWIPQFSDTNKVFKLNRYIDDKVIDSKSDLRVISPPLPEITKKSFSNGFLFITTKSYGKLKNGSNNIITKLEFNRNKIEYQDLNGQSQYGDNYIIQVFRVKVNSDFNSIDIQAVDSRGEYSLIEKITF